MSTNDQITDIRSFVTEGTTAAHRDDRFLESVFEYAPDAFLILSDAAGILKANLAACQLIGLNRSELIGRSIADTIESGWDFDSTWAKFKQDGHFEGQRWLVRADGTRRLIEIRAIADFIPARHFAIWRDVTDRFFGESHLLQRERDEALARLAGGIAHDLTNVLNVIGAHMEVLADQTQLNGDFHTRAGRIQSAIHDAATLTVQLSALGKQQLLAPAIFDLRALVQSCKRAIGSLVDKNVQLVLPEDRKPANIHADRTQVAQVVFRLTSAASELLPNGGELTIAVDHTTLKDGLARPGDYIPPGEYVVLQFRAREDTTNTIANNAQRRLPTEVCHRPVPPAVSRTLRQNHAYLWVAGDSINGTCFRAYFPTVLDVVPTVTSSKYLCGTETILLVDDDPALRETTAEYLSGLGYRVLRAGNGEEALQMIQSLPRIDALVADKKMPKMGGEELAERIAAERPAVKIMFVSGTIDSEFVRGRETTGKPILVSKPFELRTLAGKLRDLLDSSG